MLQENSEKKVEKTLAIIKPDAISHEDEIIVRIQKAGFTVTNVSETLLLQQKKILLFPINNHLINQYELDIIFRDERFNYQWNKREIFMQNIVYELFSSHLYNL